ncbi:hypothetical protein [Flavobacterium sp. DG2-3]|uniref:hypothetical protein n=1 Tax=Flavobacterium sp. DG2-3 TaxID=3068317 RepID=UPI00273EFE7A|nr:hypothetical protein [Flavobacterium sp. DG2-3]MDP5199802.1 hypothetical protein [Flavobacterium sp. DG2-3]
MFFLFSTAVYAQGGGPPPPGLPDDDPVLPIDTHSSKLLAAGLILGFVVVITRRKF